LSPGFRFLFAVANDGELHSARYGLHCDKNTKVIMDATFNQRRALFNMRTALGQDVRGIRNMTFEQASAAIDEAQKEIDTNGFPKNNLPGGKNAYTEIDGQ
jgi:hypothetical protein